MISMLEIEVALKNGSVVTYKGVDKIVVVNDNMLELFYKDPYDIERILSWEVLGVKEQSADTAA